MNARKTVFQIIGIVATTVIGFLMIPPLMKVCENKIYKASLKTDKIDYENMGPEIVKKVKSKEA